MNNLICPKCGHKGLQKAGPIRINLAGKKKQQYMCPSGKQGGCGRRTLNPVLTIAEEFLRLNKPNSTAHSSSTS